jgi:hypothetical protein
LTKGELETPPPPPPPPPPAATGSLPAPVATAAAYEGGDDGADTLFPVTGAEGDDDELAAEGGEEGCGADGDELPLLRVASFTAAGAGGDADDDAASPTEVACDWRRAVAPAIVAPLDMAAELATDT